MTQLTQTQPPMTQSIKIVKISYLKKPKFKWYVNNSLGGSFSNSGEYNTLEKCLTACLNGRMSLRDASLVIETWHGYDENDRLIVSSYECAVSKRVKVGL